MSRAQSRVPFLLNRATRLLSRRAERLLKGLGLTASQIPILHALKQGTAMYQKDLAALVEVEQPAMAELLARMERDNLIQRTTDPADRRSSRIQLSASAKRKIEPARIALQTGHQAALSGFSKSEVEQLQQFLERIVNNLEHDRP
jgi:MarR family transcriptional regulator, transcriptional regulator for hemolysin